MVKASHIVKVKAIHNKEVDFKDHKDQIYQHNSIKHRQ